MCYLQLPPSQQVRSGGLQPHVPSTTTAVLSPRTSSQLVSLTQTEPPKILAHGHVPRGKVESICIKLLIMIYQSLWMVFACVQLGPMINVGCTRAPKGKTRNLAYSMLIIWFKYCHLICLSHLTLKIWDILVKFMVISCLGGHSAPLGTYRLCTWYCLRNCCLICDIHHELVG